ncbi:MAG TPA: paraquat-inducible protein A [Burkholderiaceae bacterium]|jgi:paraquat-inducible protein A|nr:paraquat-inducible protein A [Burkholderiaceae bacterium]
MHPACDPATDAPPACSALAAGLWRCRGCGAVCAPPAAALAQRRARCPRCDAVVHPRLPDSVARSWAFLLAGTALYLPANLLPVTTTSAIGGRQSDTIFSGIVYFWKDGSYGLAVLVFVASIAVPMTKLLLLSLLLISLQRHDRRWALRRLAAWRVLEVIGRWSMLDIFAITILAALVQVESLAELQPGPGAMAFGAVVVLTMLATFSFDPRLLFDKPEGEVAPMPPEFTDPAGEAP